MIWLAALTSALSLQSAEPVTADCQLNWEQAGRRWTPAFTCPQDAPDADALQGAANEVLARSRTRIETIYPLRARPVDFTLTEQGWDLTEITPLFRAPPSYPPNAAGDGLAARCRGTIELRANGRRRSDSWECRTNHEDGHTRSAGQFARASSDAARNSYWLVPNGADAPCVPFDYEYNLSQPDGSGSQAPEFPDAEAPQCSA
ncbi:hypothetical protein [Oceanicaulis sp.]|uniref:hypothetical protein n=1 Tax=Oceanicaulis sp. TaxID=1924941 RepID=UPI003BABFE63